MEGVKPDTFVSHWWGEDFGLPRAAIFAIFAVSVIEWQRLTLLQKSTVHSRTTWRRQSRSSRSSCARSHALRLLALTWTFVDTCRHFCGHCKAEAALQHNAATTLDHLNRDVQTCLMLCRACP